MTSLLQLSVDTLEGSAPGSASLVAFHRQRSYAVLFTRPNVFDIFQWQQDKKPAWKACAVFHAHKLFRKVVAVLSIEAFDCFAFVGSTVSESILALVSFQGEVRSVYQVSRHPDIVNAEFSQKTRELYCSFETGLLVAYCLSQKADNLQLVRRKALHISVEQVQIPVQIVSLDLVGLILTLTRSGNIICLDAGKLDVVFTVMRHVFSLNPVRLWTDQFGTAFAVLCENYTTPSATPRTDQQLELFLPPTDYASCHAGMFDRCIVPLSGQLCGLTLESLGETAEGPRGTQLATFTSDGRACLFELQPSFRSVEFLNSISLNLPAAVVPESSLGDLWMHRSAPGLLRFVALRGDVCVLCSYAERISLVKVASSALSTDPLMRQLLLRPRKPAARPMQALWPLPPEVREYPQPHTTATATAAAAAVVVLEAADPMEPLTSLSPVDILLAPREDFGERLHTPPLPRTGDVRPPEPVPLLDAHSLMTDSLRDESSLLSMAVVPASAPLSALAPASYGVDWFVPERWLAGAGSAAPQGVLGLLSDRGLLLRGDARLQALRAEAGIATLSADALLERSSHVVDPAMQVRLCSAAFRAGLVCVVMETRDCRVFRLHTPTSRPVDLPVSVRHQSVVQALSCADVCIHDARAAPTAAAAAAAAAAVATRKPRGSAASAAASAATATAPRDCSLALCGDSEGFVHLFVLDGGALRCLHSDRFRAHTAPVSAVLCTGDATRPLWNLSAVCDTLGRTPRFLVRACAGSAVVTLSAVGEVKVWQPQALGGAAALSALFSCDLTWQLAGIFQLGPAGSAGEAGEAVEAHRCVALSPMCMHVLVGDARGGLSQWQLPGIVDAGESSALSTTQAAVWTAAVHRGAVTSCRVCVDDALSRVREVVFPADRTRDDVLQTLAAYARVPARARSTIGFTFAEVKRLRDNACVVTCAQDYSLVVWALERGFDAVSHASLNPVPRRRFYFSSHPDQGLAAALPGPGWELTALVNGLPQRVLHVQAALGGWLHGADEAMVQDARPADVLRGRDGLLVRYEDDLLPAKPVTPATALAHQQAVLRPQDAVDLIPVAVPIQRPPVLVGCRQWLPLHTAQRGGEGLAGPALLRQWALLREGPAVDVAVLEAREALPSDPHFGQAVRALPPPAAAALPLPIVPGPAAGGGGDRAGPTRPRSPGKVDVQFPGREGVAHEPSDPVAAAEEEEEAGEALVGGGEKVKFLARGLWLEADRHDLEATRQVVETGFAGRFVLDRQAGHDVAGSHAGHHAAGRDLSALPSHEYSLAVADTSAARSPPHREGVPSPVAHSPVHTPVHTPDHRLYSPQLEDYLSPPGSASSDEASHADDVTARTQLSVESVRFRSRDEGGKTVQVKHRVERPAVAEAAPARPQRMTISSLAEASDLAPAPLPSQPPPPLLAQPMPVRRPRQPPAVKYLSRTSVHSGHALAAPAGAAGGMPTAKRTGPASVTVGSGMSLVGPATRAQLEAARLPKPAAVAGPLPRPAMGWDLDRPPVVVAAAVTEDFPKAHVLKPRARDPSATTRKAAPVMDDDVSVQSKHSLHSLQSEDSAPHQPFHPLLSPSRAVPAPWHDVAATTAGAGMSESAALQAAPALVSEAAAHMAHRESPQPQPQGKVVHKVVLKREEGAGLAQAVADRDDGLDALAEVASTVDLKSLASSVSPAPLPAAGPRRPPPARAQPGARVVLPRKKEPRKAESVPRPLHTPQQALTLDMPDKRQESRQRHAQLVAKALDSRTAAGDALHVDDGDSLITSYFDRNAKPIFVDHQKQPPASRHQTRRQGDVDGTWTGDLADWAEGEDGDLLREGGSRPYSHGHGGRQILSGGQAGFASGPASRSGKEALLQQLLQSLNEDERRALENMDEFARERILRDLQTAPVGKAGLGPAALKAVAERALNEARDVALVRMDMSLEVQEVGDREVVVSLGSHSGGAVVVALAKDARRLASRAVAEHPSRQAVSVPAQGSVEVRFAGLRPDTAYLVHCVADLSSPTAPRTPSEALLSRPAWTLDVVTAPEVLELDWRDLSPDMQQSELRAAIRSELVQLRAAAQQPIVKLPSDDDICGAEVAELLAGPRTPTAAVSKHVFVFLEFWTGPRRPGWATGDGATSLRAEFLFLEALHACLDKDMAAAFAADGLASPEEVLALRQYAAAQVKEVRAAVSSGRPVAIDRPTPSSDPPPSAPQAVFFRFRSWYRAGQAVQDGEQRAAQRVQRLLGGRGGDADADSDSEAGLDEDRSVLEMEDSSMASLLDGQLRRRQAFLDRLVLALKASIAQVRRLYDGYLYMHQKGLREDALVMSRGNLTSTDVTAIMCAKKLFGLMHEHNLAPPKDMDKFRDPAQAAFSLTALDPCRPFPMAVPRSAPKAAQSMAASMRAAATQALLTSEEVVLQRLAGADLFRPPGTSLAPDDPPPVTITPLPGTTRRPLKPWQLMPAADQRLELALACTLLAVEELAVQDSVEVPEPEDFGLSADVFPARHGVCAAFRAWYAGEEDQNPVPGMGVPTLARVLFAEQLETRHVEQDPAVLRQMQRQKLPLPKGYAAPGDEEGEGEEEGEASRRPRLEAFESLLQAYQRAIDTSAGVSLRVDLLSSLLARVLASRRLSLAKFLWPPGLNRLGAQYFFPRMGLVVPPYSLPPHRIVLFPSRSRESYHADEVMAWYSAADLDADDALLQRAEQHGVKQRAYLDWLSREEERIAEMRILMADEDAQSRDQRATLRYLDSLLQSNADRIQRLDDALEAGTYSDGDATAAASAVYVADAQRFRFQDPLAREFWYMYEQGVEFKAGSGIYNDDEVEDMLLEQQERARKAMEEAREFELYLNEEKKKRDVEESSRQKREDQDRRLKEGLARRRQLREHLEELRRLRSLRQQEEAAALARQLQEEAAAAAEREAEARLAAERLRDAQRMADELRLMAAEEALVRDVHIARLEVRLMEHEDIHSFLVEQLAVKLAAQQREHLEELRQIYEPFEPFRFQRSRVRLPALHDILHDDEEGEGEGEGEEEEEEEGESPSDSWAASRSAAVSSSSASAALRRASASASSKPSLGASLPHGARLRGRSTDRHPGPSPLQPAVRPRDFNPSKASLRRRRAEQAAAGPGPGPASSRGQSVLPFNPYAAQWELMARPQSPALLASSPAGVFTKSPLRSLHSAPLPREPFPPSARPYPPLACGAEASRGSGSAGEVAGEAGGEGPGPGPGPGPGLGLGPERASLRDMPPGASGSVETVDSAQLGQEQRDALVRAVLGAEPLAGPAAALDGPASASLFQSQESAGPGGPGPGGWSRKRMKHLLTTSAAVLERHDAQLFLHDLQARRALAFASLSTLDTQRGGRAPRGLLSRSAPRLDPLVRPPSPLTSTPTPTSTTAQSLLDFKTRKLAASASDSVLRMQRDRAALVRYVSGGAVFESDHFLAACAPGLRGGVLQENAIAMRFAQEIDDQLRQQDLAAEAAAASGAREGEGEAAPVTAAVVSPPRRKPRALQPRPKSREAVPGEAAVLDGKPRLGAILGSALAVPALAVEARREVIQRPAKPAARGGQARKVPGRTGVAAGGSAASGGSRTLPETLSGSPDGGGEGGGEGGGGGGAGASLVSHSALDSVGESRPSPLRAMRSLDLFIQTPRSSGHLLPPDSPQSSAAHSLAYNSVDSRRPSLSLA